MTGHARTRESRTKASRAPRTETWTRPLRRGLLALVAVVGAATCGEPTTGPVDHFGELSVEPAFATGEEPGEVGVTVDSMRVEVRHRGTGEVRVDTVLAYEADDPGAGWVLELASESEPMEARMSLVGAADTLYRGSRGMEVRAGTVGSAPVEPVEVAFLGDGGGPGDPGGPDDPGGPADPGTSTIAADPTEVAADGETASTITVRLFDADGEPVGESGGAVTLAATLGELTDVTDHGDGTYTAGLTGTEAGTATVTGALEGEAIADSATVAFTAGSVVVEPAEATLTALEATTRLGATAFDGAGNEVAGASFAWSSADPAVATVDDDGLVTAVSSGAARIVARLAGAADGPADTAAVTVEQAIDRVEVAPADTLLKGVGATARLAADAFDANAHPVEGVALSWTSSDPGVATVDAAGRVTSVSAGRASVSAAAGGAADSAAVAVAVRDSVTYTFAERYITDYKENEELGTFAVPPHVPELGVEVRVEIELTFDAQRDEAFALGVGHDPVSFIGEPGCPVVPDDPSLGRGWKTVGHAELSAGDTKFRARHAIEFPCYEPVDGFAQANSVHFYGLRLVYWRID